MHAWQKDGYFAAVFGAYLRNGPFAMPRHKATCPRADHILGSSAEPTL